jgi:hypothetical protein
MARGKSSPLRATGRGPGRAARQRGDLRLRTRSYKVTIGGVDAQVTFIGLLYTE